MNTETLRRELAELDARRDALLKEIADAERVPALEENIGGLEWCLQESENGRKFAEAECARLRGALADIYALPFRVERQRIDDSGVPMGFWEAWNGMGRPERSGHIRFRYQETVVRPASDTTIDAAIAARTNDER